MWGTAIVGFGTYHYKYESGREGDAPLVGLSPRASSIVVYLHGAKNETDLLKKVDDPVLLHMSDPRFGAHDAEIPVQGGMNAIDSAGCSSCLEQVLHFRQRAFNKLARDRGGGTRDAGTCLQTLRNQQKLVMDRLRARF